MRLRTTCLLTRWHMTTTVKTCFKCNTEKQISEFYKHAKMGDGHLGKCKECTRLDVVANRLKKLDYYRRYDIERSKLPHRIADSSERVRLSKQVSPEKHLARHAVNNAIRDGRLTKSPCVICGNPKVVGHHEDYSKPLDVIWLCYAHHSQYHLGQITLPEKENAF